MQVDLTESAKVLFFSKPQSTSLSQTSASVSKRSLHQKWRMRSKVQLHSTDTRVIFTSQPKCEGLMFLRLIPQKKRKIKKNECYSQALLYSDIVEVTL